MTTLVVPTQKIVDSLAILKKGIEEAKIEKSKLDGREQEGLKQLKEIHGISSIKEIDTMIAKLEKENTVITSQIQTLFAELQNSFEW